MIRMEVVLEVEQEVELHQDTLKDGIDGQAMSRRMIIAAKPAAKNGLYKARMTKAGDRVCRRPPAAPAKQKLDDKQASKAAIVASQ